MEVKFEEKFEEVLKEESKGFDIDWSLVEIKYIRYHFTLMQALPMKLDEYMVRVSNPPLKRGGLCELPAKQSIHKLNYFLQ